MGLIRGSLHILTSGAVSAKSKKQRMAAMQLAALQGRTEAEIRAAGGRSFTAVNVSIQASDCVLTAHLSGHQVMS
jgi:hypothetical protein